ncbi:MAG: transposase [Moritella sp.]|uniref:transposase n=1 Tax=Moritella sp. TaxID=78556 RepID=UPI001DF3FEDB|nr:transposase [Moritella sp.]NQY35756.1 transposase [Alteromonadaceae bacterium]NQZ52595.1 transposase [Moritella sp.]
MKSYSKELKQKVINDMRPPLSLKIPELSIKHNIPKQTIYTWRKQAVKQGNLVTNNSDSSKWSNEVKLAVIIETAVMTQAEKAEYCRSRGIYIEQIEQWKSACLSGFNTQPIQTKEQKAADIQKDKKIKQLEKELNRKEKALAETAALMVLSKKYRPGFLDEEN